MQWGFTRIAILAKKRWQYKQLQSYALRISELVASYLCRVDFGAPARYKSECILSLYPTLSPDLRKFSTGLSQPMKIKQEQLERLAQDVLTVYETKGLMSPIAGTVEIKRKITEVIAANFAEEEAIEEEARKMLASHAKATRDMDPFKMFLIAKQKLAAKRGFIL